MTTLHATLEIRLPSGVVVFAASCEIDTSARGHRAIDEGGKLVGLVNDARPLVLRGEL